MNLIYHIDKKVDIDKVIELYESVGWKKYIMLNKTSMKKMILNSHHTIQVFDGGRLVGFIRSLSDGVLYVMLQDVIVHPEYQRKGIGESLVKKMISLYENYPDKSFIRLFSEPNAEGFYISLGFTKFPLIPYSLKNND